MQSSGLGNLNKSDRECLHTASRMLLCEALHTDALLQTSYAKTSYGSGARVTTCSSPAVQGPQAGGRDEGVERGVHTERGAVTS